RQGCSARCRARRDRARRQGADRPRARRSPARATGNRHAGALSCCSNTYKQRAKASTSSYPSAKKQILVYTSIASIRVYQDRSQGPMKLGFKLKLEVRSRTHRRGTLNLSLNQILDRSQSSGSLLVVYISNDMEIYTTQSCCGGVLDEGI